MKILKSKEFWIAWAFTVVLLLCLYYFFKPSNSEINREIKRLKQENKELAKKNDSIYLVISNLENLKKQSDAKIALLESDAARQEKEVSDLNAKIKSIKKKYDKANNHTTNFTSVDIQRYFADSLK